MTQRIKRQRGRVFVAERNRDRMGARRKRKHHRTRRHWGGRGNDDGGLYTLVTDYILQEDGFNFTLEGGAGSIVLE